MSLVEHLEKLRYFYKACDFPSIQSASRAAGISQAGLSKSLQSLEEALDVPLFLRTPQGLTLTAQGVLLREVAGEIFAQTEAFEVKLKSLAQNSHPEEIRFGMYDSIAVYFYPQLSQYLKVVYPNVVLQLRVESSSGLLSNLEKGSLDAAIGVDFKDRAKSHRLMPLFDDQYSFFVSTRIDTIANHLPLIFHPDASDAQHISCERHLEPLLKRRTAARVLNFETVKALTNAAAGIGVLPTLVARPLVQQGLLRQVTLPKFKALFGKHSIGLLVRKSVFEKHPHFIDDIFRLGENWVKT